MNEKKVLTKAEIEKLRKAKQNKIDQNDLVKK